MTFGVWDLMFRVGSLGIGFDFHNCGKNFSQKQIFFLIMLMCKNMRALKKVKYWLEDLVLYLTSRNPASCA